MLMWLFCVFPAVRRLRRAIPRGKADRPVAVQDQEHGRLARTLYSDCLRGCSRPTCWNCGGPADDATATGPQVQLSNAYIGRLEKEKAAPASTS